MKAYIIDIEELIGIANILKMTIYSYKDEKNCSQFKA
jgi:hypothetical protein